MAGNAKENERQKGPPCFNDSGGNENKRGKGIDNINERIVTRIKRSEDKKHIHKTL